MSRGGEVTGSQLCAQLWVRYHAQDGLFTNGGMVDDQGKPKPVLAAIQRFREEHLRTP